MRISDWSSDVALPISVAVFFRSGLCRDRLFLGGEAGKQDGDGGALAQHAGDVQPSAMPFHDMLDDGEAQPRAAHRPAAPRIDAVEAFGEARQVIGADAFALIRDRKSTRLNSSH